MSQVSPKFSFFGRKEKGLTIGQPLNVRHHVHVDLDYNWTGEDPSEAFSMDKKLGDGAYGSVYKSKHKETGIEVAIKKVKMPGKIMKDKLKTEIDLLKKCRHKNIVSYFGCCFHQNELWILMDYCGIGSVLDLIGDNDEKLLKLSKKGATISEEHIATVLASVVKGLVYLHAKGIIHRDIKCANILINDKGDVKIADFGVSSQLGQVQHTMSIIGTPLWMAPESIQGESYDASADIWSLGITAIEFAQGKPPYFEENSMRAIYLIGMNDPPTLKEPHLFSPEFNDFIASCLQKDPSSRPTAIDLLSHPFIINAKESSSSLKELLEEYQLLKLEEDASSEKWTVIVKSADVQVKTPISPNTSCSDLLNKAIKKLPEMDDATYGLYYEPEGVWLEDAKNLFFYRKYFKEGGNNELTLQIRMRASKNHILDGKISWKVGSTENRETGGDQTVDQMKKTITDLKMKYLKECDKTTMLTEQNKKLQTELEKLRMENAQLKNSEVTVFSCLPTRN